MKTGVLIIAVLAWSPMAIVTTTTVVCAGDTNTQRAVTDPPSRQDRLDKIEQRIRKTKPHRRDTPARSNNISDEEIREIQYAVRDIFPHALVNISTVVTGCPCEDGLKCTDQVWLTAIKDGHTYELQLSHIDTKWVIGPIQQWWLEYKKWELQLALDRQQKSFEVEKKAMMDHDELIERFPVCAKISKNVLVSP